MGHGQGYCAQSSHPYTVLVKLQRRDKEEERLPKNKSKYGFELMSVLHKASLQASCLLKKMQTPGTIMVTFLAEAAVLYQCCQLHGLSVDKTKRCLSPWR